MARKVYGVTSRKLANGELRWQAVAHDPTVGRKVRVKDPKTGKTTFKTQAAAIAAKEHFELVKGTGETHTGPWTADAWVTEWTTNPVYHRAQQTTNAVYHERVKKFGQDFAGRLLTSITIKEARDWAFANKQRANFVKTMLNDAKKDGVITENPFSDLRMPKSKGRKKITPLTRDEVAKLADIADELYDDWPVFSSMIIVAAYTGMRFGEIAGLKWTDIDWERGEIHVRRQLRRDGVAPTKNGEERTIVMPDPAASAFRRIERQDTHDFVFYSRRDKKPYAYHVHLYFWSQVRVAFYASLPKERQDAIGASMDFHELRHFCGSYLADLGVSAQDIALQLGHTDGGRLAMELYIHTYEQNSRDRIRNAFHTDLRSRTG